MHLSNTQRYNYRTPATLWARGGDRPCMGGGADGFRLTDGKGEQIRAVAIMAMRPTPRQGAAATDSCYRLDHGAPLTDALSDARSGSTGLDCRRERALKRSDAGAR